MTERGRLVELLMKGELEADNQGVFNCSRSKWKAEILADFLLENGVIVQNVRLGDKIYEIISPKDREPYFITATVCAVHIADGSRNSCQHKRESYIVAECSGTKYVHKYPISKFGKSVFLTREEAEKALKESEENA